jgi:hypothetical protein
MKNIIIPVLLLLNACTPPTVRDSNGTAFNAVHNLPNDFRGIAWGTNIASIQHEMTLTEEEGDSKCYARTNDKLSIGDAKVTDISYCFYKGRFYFAVINFSGITNYSFLKTTLFEKYGAGYQANQFMEDYTWGLGSTVTIDLNYSEVSGKGIIAYTQQEISQQKEADSKIKGKAAGKEL